MSFSNLGLNEPTPFDPAVANVWGTILNTNDTIIDAATNGIVTVDASGNADIVLTSTPGSVAQDPHGHFVITGTLTGNVCLLWPAGKTRKFSCGNGTTGAFVLTLGVNNGSGAPAGATVALPPGQVGEFVDDGTNVFAASQITGTSPIPSGTIMGSFLQATAPVGWTQNNSFNDAVIRLVDSSGIGGTLGGSWTIGGVTVGGTAISVAQLPNYNLPVSDPGHAHVVSDPGHAHGYVAPFAGGGTFFTNGGGGGPNSGIASTTDAALTSVTIVGAFTSIGVNSNGSNQAHTHTWANDGTWRPSYVNSIVCSKN